MDNNAINQAIWHDKNVLVIHKTAILPCRCIKTNKVASKKVKLKLSWHHPGFYFLLVINIIAYLIVAMFVKKVAVVDIPVSEEIISRRKKKIIGIWMVAISGVASIIIGIIFNNIVLIVLSIVLFLITIIGFILYVPLVTVHNIEDDYVWLKGVCEEYLKEFSDWNDNLFISQVHEGSKAFQSGIEHGDIIKSICGKNVRTAEDLKIALKNRNTSQAVKIDLVRGVNPITIEIDLKENEKLGVNFK